MMSLALIGRLYLVEYQDRVNSAAYARIRDDLNSLPTAVYMYWIHLTIARHQITIIKGETECPKPHK